MEKTFTAKSTTPAFGSIGRKLFTVLALGVLFTACSKDDDDTNGGNPGTPGNPSKSENYFASKVNMQLQYQSTDADGPSNYTLTVTGTKDSAGGKVFNYRTVHSDGVTVTPFVYHKDNSFTLVNTPPAEVNDMIEEMQNNPDVQDFTITGLPLLQKLPNKPQVNQPLEFSEPMHMGWTQEEDDEPFRVDMYFGFSDGKVVSFEDVTTQAGTFKGCMKLQYKMTFTFESAAGNNDSETLVTQWYAKGVGLVKSVEVTNNSTTTTVLNSIANQ